MRTVENLFGGPLDIVGDIHGQYDALRALLAKLGYAADGAHPHGRKLVFVGDLVDRGPDSPAVVEQVMKMVEAGNAQCILGNHELNILRQSRKSDNAWFFDTRDQTEGDQRIATSGQKELFHAFFDRLPLALEHSELRIVHACWHAESIDRLDCDNVKECGIAAHYRRYRDETDKNLETAGVLDKYRMEQAEFADLVSYGSNDPERHWPDAKLLAAYAHVDEARQMHNPIAILTSGEERAAKKTYFAAGKFRFVDRLPWWNEYRDKQAVIIGHYWRLYDFDISEKPRTAGIDVFKDTGPEQWFGPNKNVYCVDFSVGGRAGGHPADVCRLAALRWPEATVMFDDGEQLETDFQGHR